MQDTKILMKNIYAYLYSKGIDFTDEESAIRAIHKLAKADIATQKKKKSFNSHETKEAGNENNPNEDESHSDGKSKTESKTDFFHEDENQNSARPTELILELFDSKMQEFDSERKLQEINLGYKKRLINELTDKSLLDLENDFRAQHSFNIFSTFVISAGIILASSFIYTVFILFSRKNLLLFGIIFLSVGCLSLTAVIYKIKRNKRILKLPGKIKRLDFSRFVKSLSDDTNEKFDEHDSLEFIRTSLSENSGLSHYFNHSILGIYEKPILHSLNEIFIQQQINRGLIDIVRHDGSRRTFTLKQP